jgi:hypothetical protein
LEKLHLQELTGTSIVDGEIIKTPNGNVKITGFRPDGGVSYEVKLPDGSTGISNLSSRELAKLFDSGNKTKFFSEIAKRHPTADMF